MFSHIFHLKRLYKYICEKYANMKKLSQVDQSRIKYYYNICFEITWRVYLSEVKNNFQTFFNGIFLIKNARIRDSPL